MQQRRASFYVVAKTASETSDTILSAALVHPEQGRWFYAEVVDFDERSCSPHVVAEVLPKLRKIPGTRFVKHERLGAELLDWLTSNEYRSPGLQLPAFCGLDWRSLNLVSSAVDDAKGRDAVNVQLVTHLCRPNAAALSEFYQRCGGEKKVRHNALVDAVGLAICDPARAGAINLAEIRHFEMLMGSKSAMSYRAWMRRYEAARSLAHAEQLTPSPAI